MDRAPITTTQAATAWGISRRRVQQLLLSGRVPGAYWIGRDWLIPVNTPKPIERPRGRPLKEPT